MPGCQTQPRQREGSVRPVHGEWEGGLGEELCGWMVVTVIDSLVPDGADVSLSLEL